jgi:hypothetical protein
MDSLSVLLRQFFISFFAGCVINAYLIIYYFVLKNTDILPCNILDKISHVSLSSMSSIFIFTVIAMVLGLIIEGIFQIDVEKYYFEPEKNKIFKDQNKEKHTLKGRWLKFFVAEATIMHVCKYLFEEKKIYIKAFIDDYKIRNATGQDFYDAVQMCANVIEKNGVNVYRFRDVSFIMQLMRISFFFVLLMSSLSLVYFFVKGYDIKPFFIFNSLSLIISLFFIYKIPKMSRAVGRRYICEVGLSYKALRPDRLNQEEIPPAQLDE